LNRDNTRIGK